ncbi:hypothetical protein BH18THE1_BH18THE1_02930 [soil metagenome]
MNKIFKIVIYIFAVFGMYSLGTIIYGVIVYSNALTNHSIYGQETNKTFVEDELGSPSRDTIKQLLQYCRFVNDYGANDGKEDITGDLVNTGNISEIYRGWDCNDVKKWDKKIEDFRNNLDDIFALDKMQK